MSKEKEVREELKELFAIRDNETESERELREYRNLLNQVYAITSNTTPPEVKIDTIRTVMYKQFIKREKDKMSILKKLPETVHEKIHLQERGMRDDLLAIPEAEEAGWTVSFKDGNWHNPASFTKADVTIWKTTSGWKAADLVDGYYKNHRTSESLEDALKGG